MEKMASKLNQLILLMFVLLLISCNNQNQKTNEEEQIVNKDSLVAERVREFNLKKEGCDSIVSLFRQTINEDFNYCEIDRDCKVVRGICPLGCFFIIHNENESKLEEIRKEVSQNCYTCKYKCPIPPEKLRCIEKVCYPDLEGKYSAFLYGNDCEKIVEIYGKYLVGKKVKELDFHILDFEVVRSDSIMMFKKSKNEGSNNLKLVVDEGGIIESVSCKERKRSHTM